MREEGLAGIRQKSIEKIFAALSDGRTTTRADIAEKTGLSLVTIGKVLSGFAEAGLIVQEKEKGYAPGRKSLICSLDPSKRFLIATDEGLFIVDLTGRIIEETKYREDPLFDIIEKSVETEGLIGKGKLVKSGREPDFDSDISVGYHRAAAIGAIGDSGIYIRKSGEKVAETAIVFGGGIYEGAHGRAGSWSGSFDELLRAVEFLDMDEVVIESDIYEASVIPENYRVIAPEDGKRFALRGITRLMLRKLLKESVVW